MSIWADQQVKALLAKVAEFEKRIDALEKHGTMPVVPSFIDKRTKGYKEWKNANSHQ